MTQETYPFEELWRIPKSSYTNMLDSMGRTPIVSRGTNTFIVSVNQDFRPVVTRIDATGTESAFIDNTLYQPDEFYANTDADPDNDVAAAKYDTAKSDDPQHNFSIGTDPLDSDSDFGIDGVSLPATGKIQLTWPSATGVLYRIWESPDLISWTVPRDWTHALTPPKDTLEFDLTPSNGFFRVEAEIQ